MTTLESRMLQLGVVVFLFISLIQESHATGWASKSMEAENRLLKDLFLTYDQRVRPVTTEDRTVYLTVHMTLESIISLNENDETLKTLFLMSYLWEDRRLTWNQSLYGNVTDVRIPASKIWLPDISPYNVPNEDYSIMESDVMVFSGGSVLWLPYMTVTSPCNVNLKAFPFDTQKCFIKIGSQTYQKAQLNMTDRLDTLYINGNINSNWKMVNGTVEHRSEKYRCCGEFQHIYVELWLERTPSFYVHTFVIPSILLGLLAPVAFLMPPESKERITLGSILIVCTIFLNTCLSRALPKAHTHLPDITVYYTLLLLWSVFSLMCSVLILNLHRRGSQRRKVPDLIRTIFLTKLRPLACPGSGSYFPFSDGEPISFTGLQSVAHQSNKEAKGDNGASKQDTAMEDINKHLTYIKTKLAQKNASQDIMEEWRQVALVIDRMLFLLFLFVFFMCSVIQLA